MGRRVAVRPVLREDLWKWAKKKAIDVDADASDIVELGLASVYVIAEKMGKVPDELGRHLYMMDRRYTELLSRLVVGARG